MKRIVTILSAALVLSGALHAQELANFRIGGPAPVISPEIQGDSVIFRLKADYATVVKLSGSWMPNPWGDTVDMKRGADFVWSVKLPLPPAEIYTYNFIVDGVTVNDPQNVYVQRDGTRYLPMLTVPGERSENYGEATKHGTVSHPWYDSKLLGYSRRLTVYTPYGYEANPKKKYPVLYLLHGAGGDEEAWISMGRTAQILDNLIEKGLAEPMIVVMPNGNPGQQAARTLGIPEKPLDWRAPENQNAYVRSLCEEIVPFIEKNFRAIAKPSSRAIAGLSMGRPHHRRLHPLSGALRLHLPALRGRPGHARAGRPPQKGRRQALLPGLRRHGLPLRGLQGPRQDPHRAGPGPHLLRVRRRPRLVQLAPLPEHLRPAAVQIG